MLLSCTMPRWEPNSVRFRQWVNLFLKVSFAARCENRSMPLNELLSFTIFEQQKYGSKSFDWIFFSVISDDGCSNCFIARLPGLVCQLRPPTNIFLQRKKRFRLVFLYYFLLKSIFGVFNAEDGNVFPPIGRPGDDGKVFEKNFFFFSKVEIGQQHLTTHTFDVPHNQLLTNAIRRQGKRCRIINKKFHIIFYHRAEPVVPAFRTDTHIKVDRRAKCPREDLIAEHII